MIHVRISVCPPVVVDMSRSFVFGYKVRAHSVPRCISAKALNDNDMISMTN